jgi:hypothetical protein
MKESRCSLNVSKLLKQKGFDGGIFRDENRYNYRETFEIKQFPTWIVDTGQPVRLDIVQNNSTQFDGLKWAYSDEECMDSDQIEYFKENQMYLAPTHALAIEWIKQTYGSAKIKHITYAWDAEQIDNELILILNGIQ